MTEPPWAGENPEERWQGYFVPGTTVLRNRLNITDAHELAAVEADVTRIRLAELLAEPATVPQTFDAAHLQAIHRHVFGDLYEWAGQYRTVRMAKNGSPFVGPSEIDAVLAEGFHQVADTPLQDLPMHADQGWSVTKVLTVAYAHLNVAHPFREGNGRAQRVMLTHLAAPAGIDLDWTPALQITPQSDGRTWNDHVSHAVNQGQAAPMLEMMQAVAARRAAAPSSPPHPGDGPDLGRRAAPFPLPPTPGERTLARYAGPSHAPARGYER